MPGPSFRRRPGESQDFLDSPSIRAAGGMQPLETEQGEQPHVPADEGQEEGRLQAETGEELQETGGRRTGMVEATEEAGV